jgi:hypothetical protein
MRQAYRKGELLSVAQVLEAARLEEPVWVVLRHVNPHDRGKNFNRAMCWSDGLWLEEQLLFDPDEFGVLADLASSEDDDGNLLEFYLAIPVVVRPRARGLAATVATFSPEDEVEIVDAG